MTPNKEEYDSSQPIEDMSPDQDDQEERHPIGGKSYRSNNLAVDEPVKEIPELEDQTESQTAYSGVDHQSDGG